MEQESSSDTPIMALRAAQIDSVADEPLLAPGIAGVGVTYDFAHRQEHQALMLARQ
jgi:4-hydroxybutyryl-CoA dehydratase/vinylacetyl-CoA-Delta-isomerase